MAFNQNCKLVIIQGSLAGKTFPLDRPESIIGRQAGVDIFIDLPVVSRRHARLYEQSGQYFVEDLGSSNGTFVNGERLIGGRQLNPGDKISLGADVVFEFQAERTAIAGTMIGVEPIVEVKGPPPQLIVAIPGEALQSHTLEQPRITIGRAEDNQIVISSRIISRHHAFLTRTPDGYQLTVLPEAGNPINIEGRPISEPRLLQHGDTLRIGSLDPGMMVTLTYMAPAQAAASKASLIRFGDKDLIQVGRDPTNDVVLDSPTVSRFHAQIERVGQRYRMTDLRSANGTFVNDQRVDGKQVWLQSRDVIRIGPHRFVMGEDQLDQYDETRGVEVVSNGLNKWVRKDLNILQNISLVFKPREFIVVVGQSGGGKTTLLDAIAGYRPATQGSVTVNGTNAYRNFDAIRNDIGYVPQRDIIHMELTVYQALEYAARLRMPRDTSKAERHERIMQVLEDLDMLHRKDNPISKLSGGQIKRVSIGVELLTSPGLFFLDEPTSGLDPGTETAFMHLMRRLADQGRTIVMVTHATKNVMLADKVVFLARGGYLAWFGPPDEALSYFDSFRTEREQRQREMEFDQIYAILDDPSKGKATDWAQRYQENAAYRKYILEPLQEGQPGQLQPGTSQPAVDRKPKTGGKTRTSGLYQLMVLSSRNLRILMRDRTSLLLMLLAPILIGGLDFIVAPLMGKAPFDFFSGDAPNASTTLFLLTIDSLLVAGLSQMREFVKEADVYKRERLVNLKIFPYVLSKVWVAMLLAFYQAAVYIIIRYLAYDMPGGTLDFGFMYVTMVLAVMAGMMGGLLASALAPSSSAAPMIMILLIVPQIVLSGALAPVPENVSAIASTRWAFESFIGITGMGSDVEADTCWQLSEDLRDAMTLEQKAAQGCRCMGVAIFTPGSCNFPGVGQYYKPEIDQAPPVEPPPLADKPAEPIFPEAPEPPADTTDQVALVGYFNALQAYQDDLQIIQDQYRNDMRLYEAQADIYQAEMVDYQKKRLEYETARNAAVEPAEGVIKNVREEFGWAFINKHDPEVFYSWLSSVWAGQAVVIGVYFIIILIMIKRKDS